MAAPIICIVLMSDTDERALARSRNRLWDAYPDSHAVNETTYLVDGRGATPSEIAEIVGFRGRREPRATQGVVIQISPFYSGCTKADTWEWLARMDNDL